MLMRLMAGLLVAGLILPASAQELSPWTVQLTESQRLYRFVGTVEASQEATVSAQTHGRVVALPFDVNDLVPAGALILRLSDDEQKLAVKEAKSILEAATSRRLVAKQNLDRIARLRRQQVVSQADYDQAQAEYDSAEATVKQAESVLERAEEQWAYTRIEAPYSGILTQRHIELGETVNIGQALLSGFSLSRMRVLIDVPQSRIEALRQADAIRIILPNSPPVGALATTVFPFASEAAHSFRVRIQLPELPQLLYPGMTVDVEVASGSASAIRAPLSSVIKRGDVHAVYVLQDSGPRVRLIKAGRRQGGYLEILAGLEIGETIALDAIAASLKLDRDRE